MLVMISALSQTSNAGIIDDIVSFIFGSPSNTTAENTLLDQVQTEEKRGSSQVIGEILSTEEIKIESQEYIDKFFEWNFTKINETNWVAEFQINKTILSEMKSATTLAKWRSFRDKNLAGYDYLKIRQDFMNMTNYPTINETPGIRFSGLKFNISEGTGKFDIIFDEGFKEGERAKFGFGSTDISTTTNQGTVPNQPAICNTNNRTHAVWKYDSTNIYYANKTLDDSGTWGVTTIYTAAGANVYEPVIACNGETVVIGIPDDNVYKYRVKASLDEGSSFTQYEPSATTRMIGIDVKGDRVYGINLNASQSMRKIDFFVFNKTDGSAIIDKKQITDISTYSNDYMQILVNGTGTESDHIYVSFVNDTNDDCYFITSTDGGTTFGTAVKVMAGTYNSCNFVHDGAGRIFMIADQNTYHWYYANSSDEGTTWSTSDVDVTWNHIDSVIALNNASLPTLIGTTSTTEGAFVFQEMLSYGTWSTANKLGSIWGITSYPNAKSLYNNGAVEFIYRRGGASPYSMRASKITYDGSPNILGEVAFSTSTVKKTTSNVNCTASYNGGGSGAINFTYYVNGVMQGDYNNTKTSLSNYYLTTASGLPNSTYSKNDNIYCEARAYNGTEYSIWHRSDNFTVSNSAPTITNNQSYTNVTGGFNVTATATDPDGLADISSCLVFYKLDEATTTDLTLFLNNTNKTGTYNSTNGNCTIILNISDSGQIKYGVNVGGTYWQIDDKKMLIDGNYVYHINGTGITERYSANASSSQTYALNSYAHGLSVNSNYVFASSGIGAGGRIYRLNKTSFASSPSFLSGWDCGSTSPELCPTAADDNWTFIGDIGYNLTKINASTFTITENRDLGSGRFYAIEMNSTIQMIYTTDSNGIIKKINATNITDEEWSSDKGTMELSSLDLDGNFIWVGDNTNTLYVLNEETGTTNRSFNYGTGVIDGISIDSDYVYFVSTDNYLRKLNKTQAINNNNFTAEWTTKFERDVRSIDNFGNYVYVLEYGSLTGSALWKIDKNSSQVIAVNDEVVTKTRFIDSSGATVDTIGNSNTIPSTDTTAPTYSQNSTNSTLAGTDVSHNLNWSDDSGLSGYIPSIDNCTGSFVNKSWTAMTGTSNWSNYTVGINSTVGCTMQWCYYANDTSNNWNNSCAAPYSYITTSADSTAYYSSLTDNITMADSAQRQSEALRKNTDSMAITDNNKRRYESQRSGTDALSFSDKISRSKGTMSAIIDSLQLADHNKYVSGFSRSNIDITSLTDYSARVSNVLRVSVDSFAMADIISRQLSTSRPQYDALSFSDSVSKSVGWARATMDSLSFSDMNNYSILTGVQQYFASIIDSLSFSDSIYDTVGWARDSIDSIEFSDENIRNMALLRRMIESYSLDDIRERQIALSRENIDPILLTDNNKRALLLARYGADAIAFTDTNSRKSISRRNIIEPVILGDATSRALNLMRAFGDSFALEDSAPRKSEANRASYDLLNISDSNSKSTGYSRMAIDSISLSDFGNYTIWLASSATHYLSSIIDSFSLDDITKRMLGAPAAPVISEEDMQKCKEIWSINNYLLCKKDNGKFVLVVKND